MQSALYAIPRTDDQQENAAFRDSVANVIARPQRARMVTDDATPTALLTIQLPPLSSTLLDFQIVARHVEGSGGVVGDSANWDGYAVYKIVGFTATLVSVGQITEQGKDNANLSVGLAVNLNQVQWVVTGDVNTTYVWNITLHTLNSAL